MGQQLSAEQAAERVRNALEKMREEIPQLSNLFNAFGELIAEQAVLKAELPHVENAPKEIDEVAFSQGVPILVNNAFSVPLDYLKKSASEANSRSDARVPENQRAVVRYRQRR